MEGISEAKNTSAGSCNEPEFHVLAVDDSLIDRKVVEKLLKTSSYRGRASAMAVMNASHFQLFSKVLELCKVTVVDSGKRALEILETPRSVTVEAFEINLIITDYCMPGMSGYDLLKRIKGTCALKEIPVVIMSSENVPNRIKRCLAEGAEDFFLKPLQPADMKRLRGHVRPMH